LGAAGAQLHTQIFKIMVAVGSLAVLPAMAKVRPLSVVVVVAAAAAAASAVAATTAAAAAAAGWCACRQHHQFAGHHGAT
jgi:hypothetical protein